VSIRVPTNSILTDDGAVVRRVNLIRPTANEKMSVKQFQSSTWKVINQDTFQSLWQEEVNQSPEFEVDRTAILIMKILASNPCC
jgi:hypothetical protein